MPDIDPSLMKDRGTLTAAEHAQTLVIQTMQEGAAQFAAKGRIEAAFEAAGELAPLPAYEAPDGINARAQGWLKHLHRKATTPDDWSSTGVPHPWWDRYSGAPMTNFGRFDPGRNR
jgi:hypothetical protein